ncbi:hypothetical protein [Streptomyces sp. NPDC060366]|uniref:hypothetical protein n=1 Tax=Streptomyces sp. NPDC060366 TaxID=3347105 RepID=UPI00365C42F5
MSPARRAAAPLLRCSLLSTALFALSACGIAPTGVVHAGEAAAGVKPTTLLHFVGDGTLVAVPRRATDAVDAEEAVAMVFEGPTDLEMSDGLTTELPPLPPQPALEAAAPAKTSFVVKVRTEGDTVSIELPRSHESPLSGTASDQLICTAASAHLVTNPDVDSAKVTVTGHTRTGRWRTEGSSTTCPSRAPQVGSSTVASPAGPSPAS